MNSVRQETVIMVKFQWYTQCVHGFVLYFKLNLHLTNGKTHALKIDSFSRFIRNCARHVHVLCIKM